MRLIWCTYFEGGGTKSYSSLQIIAHSRYLHDFLVTATKLFCYIKSPVFSMLNSSYLHVLRIFAQVVTISVIQFQQSGPKGVIFFFKEFINYFFFYIERQKCLFCLYECVLPLLVLRWLIWKLSDHGHKNWYFNTFQSPWKNIF